MEKIGMALWHCLFFGGPIVLALTGYWWPLALQWALFGWLWWCMGSEDRKMAEWCEKMREGEKENGR